MFRWKNFCPISSHTPIHCCCREATSPTVRLIRLGCTLLKWFFALVWLFLPVSTVLFALEFGSRVSLSLPLEANLLIDLEFLLCFSSRKTDGLAAAVPNVDKMVGLAGAMTSR